MKIGHSNHSTITPWPSVLTEANYINMEAEEEDEDEDVDFIPFLRGDTHSEASSSLSSENEGLGDGAERNARSFLDGIDAGVCVSLKRSEETKGCDEETVMQTTVHEDDGLMGTQIDKELTPSMQHGGQDLTCTERSTEVLSSNNERDGTAFLTRHRTTQRPILEVDDEDAICRRTRARHSLADYTLEELETFLQESDDDVDPPNVDDEEEYRKFLAAVLVEGADDGTNAQEDNADEDEESDADFELEIEEALESDADENVDRRSGQSCKQDRDAHMPVTRQKKRMKESAKHNKTLLRQAKVPLQPLIPYESNAQVAAFKQHGWPFLSHKGFLHYSSSFPATGFTANQIGQLYCLIHEHVQFLIQVFSVSILDPSRQEVASEVREMIAEVINRREEALQRRKVPYPGFCFHPPNLHSSRQLGSEQAANYSYWMPSIDSPVISILDVAPLRLANNFMTDVSDTVSRYRQSHLEDVTNKSNLTREPLFPLRMLESSGDTNTDGSVGTQTVCPNTRMNCTEQQSVALVPRDIALVPRDIARSVQRFYHLFNAALFPLKPPSPSVANRVLFTDAEDGLLAMGLMEYNNDWAAIRKRFLPCKSEHQIFVRQKNRAASRVPENPIKAVRRIKNSPLTAHEIAQVSEGLKLFKNDWSSVWKFVVPHRDPLLLPRQWRIANGTQKSYKKSEAVKERRRLYDRERKRVKASLDGCQKSSELEVDNRAEIGTGAVDEEDEAYVHEAFLAEPPQSSRNLSHDVSLPSLKSNSISTISCMGSSTFKNFSYLANAGLELQQESGCGIQNTSFQPICRPAHPSHATCSASPKDPSLNSVSRASSGHLVSRLHQTHKRKGAKIVKLAPGLPPVNLPPSVRVFSQPSFKKYHSEPSSKFVATAERSHASQAANLGCNLLDSGDHLNKLSNDLDAGCLDDGATCTSQLGDEDNTSQSDLHMHPLLFQAPESKLRSYLTNSCHSTRSGIYNLFPRDQFQNDLYFFRPHLLVKAVTHSSEGKGPDKAQSDMSTLDFHPLLRRVDNGTDSSATPSFHQLSADLESPHGNWCKFSSQSDCTPRIPQVATSRASLSHDAKECNLDLNIRLSSPQDNGKTSGRNINERHDEKGIPGLEHAAGEKYQRSGATVVNCSGKCADVSVTRNISSKAFSSSQSDVLSLKELPPRNNGACQCIEALHDDSMTGIVMEHEELSDSEEDIEQVEFECEEIDDSEGDEMEDDQLSGSQNKEFPFFTSKEEEIRATEALSSLPFLKKGSAAKGENRTSSAQAERPCLKRKSNSRKGIRASSRNLTDELQSSPKQSSDRSRAIPSQNIQCKGAAALYRRPRK